MQVLLSVRFIKRQGKFNKKSNSRKIFNFSALYKNWVNIEKGYVWLQKLLDKKLIKTLQDAF